MSDFKEIGFGAANWNQAINENFAKTDDKFNEILKGGSINDSGWVACATLVNGAHAYDEDGKETTAEQDANAVKRRVIDFKKFKMVLISGEITIDNFKDLYRTIVVTLPSGYPVESGKAFGLIAPSNTSKTISSFVRWNLKHDGTELTYINSTITSVLPDDANLWLPINIFYLAK